MNDLRLGSTAPLSSTPHALSTAPVRPSHSISPLAPLISQPAGDARLEPSSSAGALASTASSALSPVPPPTPEVEEFKDCEIEPEECKTAEASVPSDFLAWFARTETGAFDFSELGNLCERLEKQTMFAQDFPDTLFAALGETIGYEQAFICACEAPASYFGALQYLRNNLGDSDFSAVAVTLKKLMRPNVEPICRAIADHIRTLAQLPPEAAFATAITDEQIGLFLSANFPAATDDQAVRLAVKNLITTWQQRIAAPSTANPPTAEALIGQLKQAMSQELGASAPDEWQWQFVPQVGQAIAELGLRIECFLQLSLTLGMLEDTTDLSLMKGAEPLMQGIVDHLLGPWKNVPDVGTEALAPMRRAAFRWACGMMFGMSGEADENETTVEVRAVAFKAARHFPFPSNTCEESLVLAHGLVAEAAAEGKDCAPLRVIIRHVEDQLVEISNMQSQPYLQRRVQAIQGAWDQRADAAERKE